MFKNIDLYNPDFSIECDKLNHCSSVYSIMRDKGITKSYVYGMCFKSSPLIYDFLKCGMSSPNLSEKREYQVGERLVRQLAWVPGWRGQHVHSSNGADFWMGIENFLIPNGDLPSTFNKNNLTVAVWDITKRIELSDISEHDELRATAWAEGELISQYKKRYNKLPLLNIQDPSNSKRYKSAWTPKSVWDSNFA